MHRHTVPQRAALCTCRPWQATLILVAAVAIYGALSPCSAAQPAASSSSDPNDNVSRMMFCVNTVYEHSALTLSEGTDASKLEESEGHLRPRVRAVQAWWSAKTRTLPLTVVVHTSLDRLYQVEAQCRSWPGPLSLVVYKPLVQPHLKDGDEANDEDSDQPLRLSAKNAALLKGATAEVAAVAAAMEADPNACQLDMLFVYESFAEPEATILYPINLLRDLARLQARTDLVALLDVDFVVGRDLAVAMSQAATVAQVEEACRRDTVYVLPAFMTVAREGVTLDQERALADAVAAGGKSRLLREVATHAVQPLNFEACPECQQLTDYARWYKAGAEYTIQDNNTRYEPFILGDRKRLPWYDTRFHGYGDNKVIFHKALMDAGFGMRVMPGPFILHRRHPFSASFTSYMAGMRASARRRQQVGSSGSGSSSSSLWPYINATTASALKLMALGQYRPYIDITTSNCADTLPWWAGAVVHAPGVESEPEAALLAPAIPVVTVNTSIRVGSTPRILGVGAGHRHPQSNWRMWFRRLAVNGMRIFSSTILVKPFSLLEMMHGPEFWGKSLTGDYVQSLAEFNTAVMQLRTRNGRDPANPAGFANPINWTYIDEYMRNLRTWRAHQDLAQGTDEATYGDLAAMGAEAFPVLKLDPHNSFMNISTFDPSKPPYWHARWENYKYFYSIAKWMWQFGVKRLEVYNEPDMLLLTRDLHDTQYGAPRLWIETVQIRSMALQDAYADLSAEFPDKAIKPEIGAGAFGYSTYSGTYTSKSAVPNYQAWFLGNWTVKANTQLYGGRKPDPNGYKVNMHAYTYHTYRSNAPAVLDYYANSILPNVTADNGGVAMPIWVTEFQSSTNAGLWTTKHTMDTTSLAIKFAAQLANLIHPGNGIAAPELYAYTFSCAPFSPNMSSTEVYKNGLHWGENVYGNAPYHVSDTTLAGEVLRLFAEHLKAKKSLLAVEPSSPTQKVLAVEDSGAYYIYMVNLNDTSMLASLDLAGLGVMAASLDHPVIITTVSSSSYAEVVDIKYNAGATNVLLPLLPPTSLAVITVPRSYLPGRPTLSAATTTFVCAGASSATGVAVQGASSSAALRVGTQPGDSPQHESTCASLVTFDLNEGGTVSTGTAVFRSGITTAVLELSVAGAAVANPDNVDRINFLILGFDEVAANCSVTNTTTWASCGVLAPLQSGKPIKVVQDNFINWDTPGLQVAGHVTVDAAVTPGTVRRVDVTRFVKSSGPNGRLAFLLLRVLRAPEAVSDSPSKAAGAVARDHLSHGMVVEFHGAASKDTAARPKLLVF